MPKTVPANSVEDRSGFQAALLAWYRVHHRRLPWRDSPSVYKTVVSEFMLQQTQVATVLPYFERWTRELPDFAALAAAPESRVMKLWEGLGYYSRARNLHKLAKLVAAMSAPPRSPADWQQLPGIGPYSSAAITSIAFGESVACVDGNVVRILARLTAEGRTFRDGSEAARHFTPLANDLVARADPGSHNQAMMELGATVCTRQNPKCGACPVSAYCAALKSGQPAAFPRLQPKKTERRTVARVFCVHRGRILLHRVNAGAKRLAGLLELPEASQLGLDPAKAPVLATRRRAITRFQITESIHDAGASKSVLRRADGDSSLEWIPLGELDSVTLSGPHRRWVSEILAARRA